MGETSTPAHLVLGGGDTSNLINTTTYHSVGINTLNDSTAFKKIQAFSKTNSQQLFSMEADFTTNFKKISTLYNIDLNLNNALSYGTYRQHNYTSLKSNMGLFSTLIDKPNLNLFLAYNYGQPFSTTTTNLNTSELGTKTIETFQPSPIFNKFLQNETQPNSLKPGSDSKVYTNNLRYFLMPKFKNLAFGNLMSTSDMGFTNDLSLLSSANNPLNNLLNKPLAYKFSNLKSSNLQFLSSERNSRLVNNVSLSKNNYNYSSNLNLTEDFINNTFMDLVPSNELSLMRSSYLN